MPRTKLVEVRQTEVLVEILARANDAPPKEG